MRNVTRITMITTLITFLAGLILMVFITGCTGENVTMDPIEDNMTDPVAIPGIDTTAPVTMETATFALG